MCAKRKYRRLGFTFIEVFIVITIFSVIVLAVYGVSRAGFDVYRRSRNFDPGQRRIIMNLERLAEDLRGVVPLQEFGSDLPESWRLVGSSRDFSYIAICDQGLCRLSYSFIQEADNSYKLKLIRYDLEGDIKQQERIIAKGIVRKSTDKLLRYLAYDAEEDNFEWVDEWDRPGLPEAVQVKVAYKSAGDDVADYQVFTKNIFILR